MIYNFPPLDKAILPFMGYGSSGDKGDIISTFESIPELVAACRDGAKAFPRAYKYVNDGGPWHGDSWQDTLNRLTSGHLPSVGPSDNMLAKLEDLTGFDTKSFRTVNDVVGGSPNVGAYLSGNPMNMRRRNRVSTESAPLTILVDLCASASIDAKYLVNRGSAVLALVRVLSARRPVNLYVGSSNFIDASTPSGRTSSSFMVRIDSTPLDLARAAYILTAPSILRRLAFGLCTAQDCGNVEHGGLPFAYANPSGYASAIHAYWSRIVPMGETLAIPPLHGGDDFKDPIKWVREMITKYGNNPDAE